MVQKDGKIYAVGIFFVLLMSLYANKATAQSTPPNNPYYDDSRYHFGMLFGYSRLYSNMVSMDNLPYNDSIYSFNAGQGMGFHLGIIGDLKLLPFVHLRLLPTIAFEDRKFDFYVEKEDVIHKTHSFFEVIYAEIPLEMKISAKRWWNFRPYLIGGIKYSYDLGSIKRKKLSADDFLFKIDSDELLYTLGVGFDFYFPMFKFAIEIKSSFGINDILIHDYPSVYADCIKSMKSQLFYFNITFE